jgi:hypothetical protein
MLPVMALLFSWRRVLLSVFAISSLSLAMAWGRSSYDQKLDRSWKRYHNHRYGYCVSYPSRWMKGEAFEGAGLFVQTGVKRFSRPVGAIDFVAISTTPQDARTVPVSLADNLQDHLTGLQKFERAERMEILETRQMEIRGNAALYTKHKYYDPQERATWMEEVLFVKRDGTVYRFELACRIDQFERFAPVFDYLVGTVQFDCRN